MVYHMKVVVSKSRQHNIPDSLLHVLTDPPFWIIIIRVTVRILYVVHVLLNSSNNIPKYIGILFYRSYNLISRSNLK